MVQNSLWQVPWRCSPSQVLQMWQWHSNETLLFCSILFQFYGMSWLQMDHVARKVTLCTQISIRAIAFLQTSNLLPTSLTFCFNKITIQYDYQATFAYTLQHQTLGAPYPPYWFGLILLQLFLEVSRVHMFPFKNSSTVSQSEKVRKDKISGVFDSPLSENNTDDVPTAYWQNAVCVVWGWAGMWGVCGQVFLCISACAVGVVHACVPLTIIGDPFSHDPWLIFRVEISLVYDTKLKGPLSHVVWNNSYATMENISDGFLSPLRDSALWHLYHMMALLHHL